MAQREARPLKASLRGGHIFVSRVVIKQGKKSLQVVTRRSLTSATRSLSLSSGLNLRHNHTQTRTYDRRPCQRISSLQAPVHTAASQLGSNASACLQRFSLCFTLPGLAKHTRGPLCRLLEPQRRPTICSQDNDVCELFSCSCREMVRNWPCRSVLMYGDVTGSSPCNVKSSFQ